VDGRVYAYALLGSIERGGRTTNQACMIDECPPHPSPDMKQLLGHVLSYFDNLGLC